MIMAATKVQKSSSPSQLPITDKSSKGDTNAFSKLLHSISTQKDGKHTVKEGTLVLKLGNTKQSTDIKATPQEAKDSNATQKNAKKMELVSLLKTDEQDAKSLMLNPQLTAGLDAKALKAAIKDAKNYLKDQIKNSPAYKQGEIKELPKTTKGLVALAKKVGVDVEKITLQTVRQKDPKEIKTDVDLKVSDKNTKDTQLKTKSEKLPHTSKENISVKETVSTKESRSAQVDKVDNTTQKPVNANAQQVAADDNSLTKVPLFKLSQSSAASHTTAELVNKKQVKNEKTISKADNTLRTLLHGDKGTSKQAVSGVEVRSEKKADSTLDSKHKTHSSVLSQLLHGDAHENKHTPVQKSSDDQSVKPVLVNSGENSLHVKDTEKDLGVKIHEAKQMVKYLANDIKQAIEDYKPPFTRIKVKLNPAKLGEVDLTVVQRGKNVHVNISSNSAAINTLAQNANDLKIQLNQNGMNNASLNFNSSSDNQSQQQQQQSGHQRENAKKAYEYFDNDETNEEILSSLEIVVPRYI